MRVLCRRGHLALYPSYPSEINAINTYFGIDLQPEEDYYTFPGLFGADNFSIEGSIYLNLPAVATFEGKPWEVIGENRFVYSLATDLLVPKTSVTAIALLSQSGYYFIAQGLLQPGSRTSVGSQILSYDGEFDIDTFQTRLMRYDYE